MRVNSMLFTGKPISSARSLSQGHLMNKSSVLDELVGKLGQVLPAGAIELKEDFEKNARAAVQSTLAKMDLVTREEFDIQAALLQRTREKLDRLEKLLDEQQANTDSGQS